MKLRLKITKEGDARFISHLEYARTLNRALRRAKLPVAYSEGFNPHIKMSLASALGVGIASLSEYAEVELDERVEPETAMAALNKNLPTGIRVLECDVVVRAAVRKLMAMLAWASYEILLPKEQNEAMLNVLALYNEAEQLIYLKKSAPKKPAKQVDVKAFVPEIAYEATEQGLKLSFICRITQAGSLKAHDLLKALQQHYGLDFDVMACGVTRTALYREDKKSLLDD